jgi:phosphoribosylformylglycinamidine synthase PurS subunit
MKYRAKIEVSLKPGTSDPEGNTTKHLLRELGYLVEAVNVSKVFNIQLQASTFNEAVAKAEEMARRLLANPTKDNYSLIIEEQK